MTIIVTGAASGIGLAVVQRLVSHGRSVVAIDVDAAALNSLPPDPLVQVRVADSRDDEAIDSICREAAPITGVVACAGISRPGASVTYAKDDWTTLLDINLTAVFSLLRSAVTNAEPGASFVAISSISGLQGFAGRAAYSASKAGIDGLVRSLAVEFAPTVRVNAVAPGYVRTALVAKNLASGVINEAALLRRTPMRRLGEAADIASTVGFLLSDDSSWITGTTIVVDGGWLAGGLGMGDA